MNLYRDVCLFHQKFGLPIPEEGQPRLLTEAEFAFRFNLMHEELKEWHEACARGDLVKAADALADLTYVVLGTAAFHRVPFNQVWNAVQAANMTKIRATAAEQSKRGSTLDVIKPPGFIPPEAQIKTILLLAGWRP